MRRKTYRAPLMAVTLLIGLGGCKGGETPAAPPPKTDGLPTAQAETKKSEVVETPKTETASADTKQGKEAIQNLLEEKDSPLPKGTRLLSFDFDEKTRVVTLDFSKEFNALIDSGETAESEAQKRLRSTLQKFSAFEKMRVTVEGKPFESQATDWNTPFPVRFVGAPSGKGLPKEGETGAFGGETR